MKTYVSEASHTCTRYPKTDQVFHNSVQKNLWAVEIIES